MSKKSRKHYLILPSYQIKLVGFMIMVIFLGSIMHGFFLYKITSKNIEDGFLSAHNRLRSTWEILKPAIVVTNGLSFLVSSLFLLLITVFLSHRIIGPIFKISGHIKKISNGKLFLSSLRLRKGDEGQILCDAVNEMQEHYRQHFIKIKNLRNDLSKSEGLEKQKVLKELDEILSHIELEKD